MRQKLYFKIPNHEQPNSGVSSTIQKVRYDDNNKTLFVDFHNGNTYKYPNVSKDIYEDAVKAESIGSYLHSNVYKKFKSDKIR